MTEERRAELQGTANKLSAKLQALHKTLPPDEQLVLFHLLNPFAGSASIEDGRLTAAITLDLPEAARSDWHWSAGSREDDLLTCFVVDHIVADPLRPGGGGALRLSPRCPFRLPG